MTTAPRTEVALLPLLPGTGFKVLWRYLPVTVFLAAFVMHALYMRHVLAAPLDGWADNSMSDSFWGLGPYLQAQEYFVGFSYALGAAFALWSVGQFVRSRRAAAAAGAVGSVTLVGVLLAGGCFLLGCCGSPMLAVYTGIFGAKALGAGKPLMALVTLLSVGCGYWCLSRRLSRGDCFDTCCARSHCE